MVTTLPSLDESLSMVITRIFFVHDEKSEKLNGPSLVSSHSVVDIITLHNLLYNLWVVAILCTLFLDIFCT